MKKLVLLLALVLSLLIGTVAMAEPVDIEGKWKVTEFVMDDEEINSFLAIIISNGEITMTFEDGKYSIVASAFGETGETSSGTYKLIGDMLLMDQSLMAYTLNGNQLILEDGTDSDGTDSHITLERIDEAAPQPAVTTTGSGVLDGTRWKLVKVESDDAETQSSIELVLQFGEFYVDFQNGQVIMSVEIFGSSQTETMAYEKIDEQYLRVTGEDDFTIVEYAVNGNTLTWNNIFTGIHFEFEKVN